jgi:hypothetical protein
MSVPATRPVRADGLIRTTLRIDAGLSATSLFAVVHALQRVPGVLTVEGDAENAQAFVAHDAAVPAAALVAAARRAGSAAKTVVTAGVVVASASPGDTPQKRRRPLLSAVGVAAMLAIICIDVALANSPEKRWIFIFPVIAFWAVALVRATLRRRS